jgi:hypothetical protein
MQPLQESAATMPNATDRTTSRARNDGSVRAAPGRAQSIRLRAECTHNLMAAAIFQRQYLPR